MGINKKHIGKIDNANLDDWLSSLGFIYPTTDIQLDRFNKYFEDYPFKLKDASIDAEAIINNTFKHKAKIMSFRPESIDNEITELKMVARKGNKRLPQHIIDKMKNKHHKKPDNE